jgi:hypothetical protein
MRWIFSFTIGMVGTILLITGSDSLAQRRGGFGGGVTRGAAVTGPYGGAGVGTRSTGSVVGPAGGSRTVGSGGGSYTTKGGSTINYAGAGAKGSTPGGVNYGKGVGGVQVTTPGGQTVTKVGSVGGAAGPGGSAVAGRSGATVGSGPGGSFGSAYRGGVAIGPQGGVAGGTRVGTATGPAGNTVSGAARGGVAVGPYGAIAGGSRVRVATGPGGVAVGGSRTVAGRSPYGTYYASRGAIVATGGAVRTHFGYYHAFTPAWYARYPGAWFAAGWTAARIWSAPAWGTVSSFCSYPAEPIYYDYGDTIVYSGNSVTINGETEIPTEQYVQQAIDLATAGNDANVKAVGDDFQPLGVFAMVEEGEEKSTNIFQLAVSKDGVLRGNYYNAMTDTSEPIYGSVDKKTQRAAWTVADRKTPVYEAGIANLTRDETTMLVHFGKDNDRQFLLVRIQQPEGEQVPDGK